MAAWGGIRLFGQVKVFFKTSAKLWVVWIGPWIGLALMVHSKMSLANDQPFMSQNELDWLPSFNFKLFKQMDFSLSSGNSTHKPGEWEAHTSKATLITSADQRNMNFQIFGQNDLNLWLLTKGWDVLWIKARCFFSFFKNAWNQV